MRHATWLKIEASPFWYGVYRGYRTLPGGARAPLRWLTMPRWHLAVLLVRTASRNRVVAGPFRGMKLALSGLSGRHLLGYILGSQERELHEVIDRVVARRYGAMFNVGAADGYYAVGLARRCPSTRVAAFEALTELHPVIARSAAANGVGGRIAIAGTCDAAQLRDALDAAPSETLVLMDIEGGEVGLLDPKLVPQLRQVDILVETHDAFVAGATETLIDRFWQTHEVECYSAQPRILDDFPAGFLPFLKRRFPRLAVDLMSERRTGCQRWLFLTAKRNDAAGTAAG
ncbi:MAG TPA: hypothetical protein VND87_01025 [Stellaceae bacterium]|nr:hypothetical protein [Stellaceae bacterium]